jgi:hypothetical protein
MVMTHIHVVQFRPFSDRDVAMVGLEFRYDAGLVAQLKAILRQAWSRCAGRRYPGGWLAEHRRWYVEPGAWPYVRRRLEESGYTLVEDGDEDADEEDDDGAAAKPTPRPLAWEPVVQTWYRRMALRFHPDRGGSHEAMLAINVAHDELRRLFDGTQ